MKKLQSPAVASILGLLLFCATLALTVKVPAPDTSDHDEDNVSLEAITRGPKESWLFHNPEIDLLIQELKQEKEELTRRATELEELAARLKAEREEINQITQQVYQVQADVNSRIQKVKDAEINNLKKLAKTFAGMPADSAAKLLLEQDDKNIVNLLAAMKEAEVARLLDAMTKLGGDETKRAARISEQLRILIAESSTKKKT